MAWVKDFCGMQRRVVDLPYCHWRAWVLYIILVRLVRGQKGCFAAKPIVLFLVSKLASLGCSLRVLDDGS